MLPIKLAPDFAISSIRPLHERIILIRDEKPTHTAAGLDISMSRDKANTGTIISVGARCTEAKRDMHVMHSKAAGTEVTINGQSIVIMHEQDLWFDLDTMLPFHDKVLIKPEPMPEIIKNIIIPATVEDAPKMAKVISVGPQVKNTKADERVLIGSFAGLQVGEYLILREADLFASLD